MSDEAAMEHPVAEKLSAYLADELSPEEDDAIQEHMASCRFCAERVLELQGFLEFAPEQPGERVAELETAAEWRKLRQRIERKTEKQRFFASARGGYSLAAALLVVSVGLAVWNLNLVRESREPVAVRTVRTLGAEESLRGASQAESEPPLILPAQITLSLPVETPEPLYRIELFPSGSRLARTSFKIPPQETELRFLLPEKALPPGRYTARVHGLRDGQPVGRVWTYELAIGSSNP